MKRKGELIEITPISYKKGDLRIGNAVIALTDIRSREGDNIKKGERYKVIRLLEQSKYPGGFIINYNGKEWGFYLGEGAEWWGILKEDKDDDEISIEYLIGGVGETDIGITEFETIPYTIYKIVDEKHIINIKDLVNEVAMRENLFTPKEKNVIRAAINNLMRKGYLAMLERSNNVLLTPQGKKFFEEDTTEVEEQEIIDNNILIKEIKKGKTVIVDDPDIIEIMKKHPNLYFLVENDKGTYDLGAIYNKESKNWIIARKYRREE